MGDTGSLSMGGALGAISVVIKHELVLALVGVKTPELYLANHTKKRQQSMRRAWPAVPLSIDTMKPRVAEAAIRAGADIVNDIWGFARDLTSEARRTAIAALRAGKSDLPLTPMAESASRTSSSLNGLIIAVTSFMMPPRLLDQKFAE